MKFKIGIDVDNTLLDTVGSWIKAYGYSFSPKELTDYCLKDITEKYDIPLRQYLEEITEMYNWIDLLLPVEDDLKNKMPNYSFDILTVCLKPTCTYHWVKYQQIPFDSFVWIPNSIKNLDIDKHSYSYNILIDDNPLLYNKIQEDQFLIIYERPFNVYLKKMKPRKSNVFFAKTWIQIREIVDEIIIDSSLETLFYKS